MAIDEVAPVVATLDQLRQERNDLRSRIGDGPADPTWEYRQLTEALAREKHEREGAQWRLDNARKSLQELGPIGRRTRRRERRELEGRIGGFSADIVRHDTTAAGLEAQLADLTPEMLARTRWECERSTDLDRLDTLDRHIDLNQRLEQVAARKLERGLERGIGIEL
jgi:hypothetical protein